MDKTYWVRDPENDTEDEWTELEKQWDAEDAAEEYCEQRDNDSAMERYAVGMRGSECILVKHDEIGPPQAFTIEVEAIPRYNASPKVYREKCKQCGGDLYKHRNLICSSCSAAAGRQDPPTDSP